GQGRRGQARRGHRQGQRGQGRRGRARVPGAAARHRRRGPARLAQEALGDPMKKLLSVVLAVGLAAPAFGAAAKKADEGAAQDKTYEKLKVLIDVLNLIQENYVEQPDTQKLIDGAADGMVRTLDPFSQFMDVEEHKEIT